QSLALLLILGMGHSMKPPVDASKALHLSSRLACDGYTAPVEEVSTQMTFSSGVGSREFVVSRMQKDACDANVKVTCLHKLKAGWRDVWSAANVQSSVKAKLPLASCYAHGSKEPADYILSGWYKEGALESKAEWQQATLKQVSSNPEVYEFADPSGGTARLEITRREQRGLLTFEETPRPAAGRKRDGSDRPSCRPSRNRSAPLRAHCGSRHCYLSRVRSRPDLRTRSNSGRAEQRCCRRSPARPLSRRGASLRGDHIFGRPFRRDTLSIRHRVGGAA